MLKDVIEADFAAVLAEGFSAALEFPVTETFTVTGPATLELHRPGTLSIRASVTETTLGAEVDVGGVRPKRTFSATLSRAELIGPAVPARRFFGGERTPWSGDAPTTLPAAAPYTLPRPGGIVRMDGELFRIVSLQTSAAAPLATLEFSER